MSTDYSPKGKILLLLAEMERDPARVWSIPEAGAVMGVRSGGVIAAVTYALRAERMYRGLKDGRAVLSGTPFPVDALPPPTGKKYRSRVKSASGWETDPDDLRIPRVVPGWKPPVMVPPRATA